MSLFLKIFLWFWLATALVVGALTFVTWTLQTEPFFSRWRYSVGNSVTIYAETARQIYENEGERGVREFLQKLKLSPEPREACLAGEGTKYWCSGEIAGQPAQTVIQKALTGNAVEFEMLAPEENYVARKFTTAAGENFVLVLWLE